MSTMAVNHPVVSQEQWLRAREALLVREKELTHLRDEVTRKRLELPWVRLEKDYVFDAPNGTVSLADLFDGRSQLFIKHFMKGPNAAHQCVGCSLEVDHVDGLLEHLHNHDITYAVVARAPIDEIEETRKQMGWRFPWVSSYHNDFSYDFHVSFKPEQVAAGQAVYNFQPAPEWAVGLEDLSGNSVFYKDERNQIFHTYSTYGRGGEQFLGIYGLLDVMPKGRNETGPYHSLTDWARPRNMYEKGGSVEGNGRYHAPRCGCANHS